ncbi:MAG TPA: TetR family transcriptional regulator C-terminal domain-containing protein [Candidatus Binatia bacterium]|nr:TetR family transcriptional regulator C-terminal domain-containing protein [Candidatus Binatia bacterium]
MAQLSVREKIVAAAAERFHTLGYNACGVQEIVDAAGVPKGSFYNYFKAKELLAREVLDNYWADAGLDVLADKTIAPLERLRRHFRHIAARYKKFGFENGCLVPKFMHEVSDSTPLLRTDLRRQVARWTGLIGEAIREGQADQTISNSLDADTTARFLVESWGGVTGAMKLAASRAPIDDFFSVAFGALLQPSAPTSRQRKTRV